MSDHTRIHVQYLDIPDTSKAMKAPRHIITKSETFPSSTLGSISPTLQLSQTVSAFALFRLSTFCLQSLLP